jgi:hypothetical protein
MPSFSITKTAAIAAFIFAMIRLLMLLWGYDLQILAFWEAQQIYI